MTTVSDTEPTEKNLRCSGIVITMITGPAPILDPTASRSAK